jgi:signal peptidase I
LIKKICMKEISPLITETLQNGGEIILTVTGNSMCPVLHHGRDRVCLARCSGKPLKKYDIALYKRQNGKYILHRIIAVKRDGYVIAGDNQYVMEYPVLPHQIIGTVKGFWRKEKYISCDNFLYQAYCRIWVFIYPIRRILVRTWSYLKRFIR